MHAPALFLSCAAALLISVDAVLMSPGLRKCTQVGDDNSVVLTACSPEKSEKWSLSNGLMKSLSSGTCLEASAPVPNGKVYVAECDAEKETQQWEYTAYGYIQLQDSKQCLDVKALKINGKYESWDQIKAHETNTVHIYKCHDPETTKRVNQLWVMSPSMTQLAATRKWSLGHDIFEGTSNFAMMAMAAVGACGFLAAGVFAGRRLRSVPTPREPMLE